MNKQKGDDLTHSLKLVLISITSLSLQVGIDCVSDAHQSFGIVDSLGASSE